MLENQHILLTNKEKLQSSLQMLGVLEIYIGCVEYMVVSMCKDKEKQTRSGQWWPKSTYLPLHTL